MKKIDKRVTYFLKRDINTKTKVTKWTTLFHNIIVCWRNTKQTKHLKLIHLDPLPLVLYNGDNEINHPDKDAQN